MTGPTPPSPTPTCGSPVDCEPLPTMILGNGAEVVALLCGAALILVVVYWIILRDIRRAFRTGADSYEIAELAQGRGWWKADPTAAPTVIGTTPMAAVVPVTLAAFAAAACRRRMRIEIVDQNGVTMWRDPAEKLPIDTVWFLGDPAKVIWGGSEGVPARHAAPVLIEPDELIRRVVATWPARKTKEGEDGA